jgi:hypothetical protein
MKKKFSRFEVELIKSKDFPEELSSIKISFPFGIDSKNEFQMIGDGLTLDRAEEFAKYILELVKKVRK